MHPQKISKRNGRLSFPKLARKCPKQPCKGSVSKSYLFVGRCWIGSKAVSMGTLTPQADRTYFAPGSSGGVGTAFAFGLPFGFSLGGS